MNSAKLVMLLNRASPKVSRVVGRGGLHFSRHRPNALFAAGLVTAVGSTVLACRATLKLSDTLDEIEKDVDHARATDHDVAVTYVKSAAKLAKLYGPSLAVGVVSVGCLSGAHLDLTRRNASLVAAYSSLQAAFKSYRDRVRADIGDERELALYRGILDELSEIEETDTSRVFGRGNVNWEGDAEINRIFITIQQNHANELLRARGHVFLNDVYDMLGFDRTKAGAVLGWIVDPDGNNWVDFGIYDNHNSQFLDGRENAALLTFNIMGLVFHLLEEE